MDISASPETVNHQARAELAVVVIALRAPDSLLEAVSSLLHQETRMEIVVVNTGGGQAAAKLNSRGLDVTVIEREEALYPGAARNIGIKATTAEFVAFLASDCQAGPGWAAKRLAKHRAGFPAVASALLPIPTNSVIAWASHLSLFVRRLPQNSRLTALPYGASFRRSLFDTYGLFSEELRTGEDTDFALRLPLALRPVWAPDVVTFHQSPTRLRHMLRDQFRRGRLASSYWRKLGGRGLISDLWRRMADPIRLSRRIGAGKDDVVHKAWLLMPLCAGAYCLGLAIGSAEVTPNAGE